MEAPLCGFSPSMPKWQYSCEAWSLIKEEDPNPNPWPDMVTVVPPNSVPNAGATDFTTGLVLYTKGTPYSSVLLVPSMLILQLIASTETESTAVGDGVPYTRPGEAGASHRSLVAEITVAVVDGCPSTQQYNAFADIETKLEPVKIRLMPPSGGDVRGETDIT